MATPGKSLPPPYCHAFLMDVSRVAGIWPTVDQGNYYTQGWFLSSPFFSAPWALIAPPQLHGPFIWHTILLNFSWFKCMRWETKMTLFVSLTVKITSWDEALLMVQVRGHCQSVILVVKINPSFTPSLPPLLRSFNPSFSPPSSPCLPSLLPISS